MPCPAGDGTSLRLDFRVRAKATGTSLTWRRSPESFDAVFPGSGSVNTDGLTNVSLTDVVLADRVSFEVVNDGGQVVLRFTLRHR